MVQHFGGRQFQFTIKQVVTYETCYLLLAAVDR